MNHARDDRTGESSQLPAARPNKSICILAAKDLRRNTRVARQAATLSRAGWAVTVAALELPVAPAGTDIRFIRVQVPHPLQKMESRRLKAETGQPRENASTAVPAPSNIRSSLVGLARSLAMPFGHIISSRAFARASNRILADEEFDIVQSHDAPALRAAARLARRCEACLIYDGVECVDDRAFFLDSRFAKALRRLESSLQSSIIRSADTCFSIGPALSAWMQQRYAIERPLAIRNCRLYEPRYRDRALRDLVNAEDNTRIVVCPNSIRPDRGADLLLDSLVTVSDDVCLVFIGEFTPRSYEITFMNRVEALGLSQRVKILAPVQPDALVRFLSGADVGVIPFENTSLNNYLSLPNRLFELLMARVPVIAPEFPEMAGLIDEHGVGLTFEPGSASDLARALTDIMLCLEQLGLEQRLDSAADRLCWERESRTYLDAIDTLFDDPPP